VKTVIHVNNHVIRANRKNSETNPPLTVKTYKSVDYGHNAIIHDAAGNEVARVVHSPHKPLSCGATVWIETEHPVVVKRDLDPTKENQ
jgi:hypothetical protein